MKFVDNSIPSVSGSLVDIVILKKLSRIRQLITSFRGFQREKTPNIYLYLVQQKDSAEDVLPPLGCPNKEKYEFTWADHKIKIWQLSSQTCISNSQQNIRDLKQNKISFGLLLTMTNTLEARRISTYLASIWSIKESIENMSSHHYSILTCCVLQDFGVWLLHLLSTISNIHFN